MRPLFFGVLTVFLSILVLGSYLVYRFAHAPFSSAQYTDYRDSSAVWNETHGTTLTLILVDDINNPQSAIRQLALLTLDAQAMRYSLFIIPVDTEVEYPLAYGTGPLKNLYAVGNADQNRGVYLVQKMVLKTFAVHSDGYLITDTHGMQEITDVIGTIDPHDISASLRLRNIPKIPTLISTFRENVLTNLKFSDLMSVEGFFRQTSHTSSFVTELNKYQVLDPIKFDDLWQSRQSYSDIQKEAVKVFIANASKEPKVPGLAGWGGRVVRNAGADVLEDQNSFTDFSQNTIITTDASLQTVRALQQAFEIDTVLLQQDLLPEAGYNPQIFRTKVSLILVGF